MSQRSYSDAQPMHGAIIMDGNGRWATQRAMPRVAGHRVGVDVVRKVVEAAPDLGIGTLTLYAFSSDNWKRPPSEVAALMTLFRRQLAKETPELTRQGVRLSVIGRRDRLSPTVLSAIDAAEATTARGPTMHLRLAIDYSAREAIVAAARQAARAPGGTCLDRDAFADLIGQALNAG